MDFKIDKIINFETDEKFINIKLQKGGNLVCFSVWNLVPLTDQLLNKLILSNFWLAKIYLFSIRIILLLRRTKKYLIDRNLY